MKRTVIVDQRFNELIQDGTAVLQTRTPPPPNVSGDDRVDLARSQGWATSVAQFLSSVFGKESEYCQRFQTIFKYAGYYSYMTNGLAILKAAWNDYSKGYLFRTESLIRAEVFDDMLDQAEHLHAHAYFQAAAVVAGCVLEDALRKMCKDAEIPLTARPKLDGMNSELAKKGIYNSLVQKRITWLADIRNKAAHGNWKEFSSEDVTTMLSQIRNFVTDYLA